MNEIPVDEFVRRLGMSMKDHGCRFVFFLGAGCSVSSEIPTASTLVKRWLPKLKKLKTGNEDDVSSWATNYFDEYNDDQAGKFYGKVMEDLFTTSKSRQTEIERLVEGKDPAIPNKVMRIFFDLSKPIPENKSPEVEELTEEHGNRVIYKDEFEKLNLNENIEQTVIDFLGSNWLENCAKMDE